MKRHLVGFAIVILHLPCQGAAMAADPPRLADIATEIRHMRAMFDDVSVVFVVERRAYTDESMTTIASQRFENVLDSRDGRKRLRSTVFGMDQPIGVGPSRTGIAIFDGRDTYRIGRRSSHATQPGVPVMVKPGFDSELFSVSVLDNFESAIWGDMVRPLDEVLGSGDVYAISVSPQLSVIRGHGVWTLTFRTRPASNGRVEIWNVAVAPDLGMLPIQSTLEFVEADGSTRLVSGKWAEDSAEVKPGLWIPRTITFGDPRQPDAPTYSRLRATSISEGPEIAEILADVSTGERDMIDFRTNERYVVENGRRGASQRITDAKAVQRELDRYMSLSSEMKLASNTTEQNQPSRMRVPGVAWIAAGMGLIGVMGVLRLFRRT